MLAGGFRMAQPGTAKIPVELSTGWGSQGMWTSIRRMGRGTEGNHDFQHSPRIVVGFPGRGSRSQDNQVSSAEVFCPKEQED